MNEEPEQTVSVILDMEGLGLTVTVTVKDVPLQVPVVGVTV